MEKTLQPSGKDRQENQSQLDENPSPYLYPDTSAGPNSVQLIEDAKVEVSASTKEAFPFAVTTLLSRFI